MQEGIETTFANSPFAYLYNQGASTRRDAVQLLRGEVRDVE